jgi:hypothetical protein
VLHSPVHNAGYLGLPVSNLCEHISFKVCQVQLVYCKLYHSCLISWVPSLVVVVVVVEVLLLLLLLLS